MPHADQPTSHLARHRGVVALGSLAKSSSFIGQSFWITAFVDPLIAATGLSRTMISAAYASATVLSAVLASQLGRLADRRGVVTAWLVAGLGAAFGSAALAISTSFVAVALSLATVRACGQGGLPLVGALTILRGMPEPRGVAMSISNGALTITGGVVPLAAAAGVATIGWRPTLLIASAVVVGTTVAGALIGRRHQALTRPGRRHTAADIAPGPAAITDARRPRLGIPGWSLLYVLALAPMIVTALVFHAFDIGREAGVGQAGTAATLSAMAVVGLAGGVAAGAAYDRWDLRPVLLSIAALLAAGPALLLIDAGAAFVAAFGVAGVAAGANGVITSVAWSRTFGDDHIGSLQGIGAAGVIVGAAAGPLIPASIESLGLPPGAAWIAMCGAGALGVLATVAWRPAPSAPARNR